jgi:hypothetical protein
MDLIMKSVSWVNDAVWNKYVGSGLKGVTQCLYRGSFSHDMYCSLLCYLVEESWLLVNNSNSCHVQAVSYS